MEEPNSNPSEDNPQEPQPAPPQPLQKRTGWSTLAGGISLLAVTGGTLLLLTMAEVGCVRGATRSCRLKWEERDRQVDAAIQEQTSSSADQQGF